MFSILLRFDVSSLSTKNETLIIILYTRKNINFITSKISLEALISTTTHEIYNIRFFLNTGKIKRAKLFKPKGIAVVVNKALFSTL